MRIRSEKHAFPRRTVPRRSEGVLQLGGQAEEVGESLRHAEEPDRDPASSGGAGIARQPLGKRETVMRPLRTREDGRRWYRRRQGLLQRYVHPLAAQQVHTGAPLLSAAPIPPEQRRRSHRERMQQQTDPTWLCRLRAVPLTLLAQGTYTTVCNPGGVEHPQRAIVLGALLGRVQRLACWTTQCPVGLEGKVLSREAASFPGGGGGGWAIARRGSRRVGSLLLDRRDSRSKLGRAHGGRLQLMSQIQAQVPHPL